MSKLKALEPAEPVRRYERENPGELIHIDIKKLGGFDRVGHRITGDRTGQSKTHGIGWEFVHVCIDDHSRVAFVQQLGASGGVLKANRWDGEPNYPSARQCNRDLASRRGLEAVGVA